MRRSRLSAAAVVALVAVASGPVRAQVGELVREENLSRSDGWLKITGNGRRVLVK